MSPLPSQRGAAPGGGGGKRTGSGRAAGAGTGSGARRLRRPRDVTPARWAAWLVLRRTFEEDAWTDRAFAGVCEQLGLEGRERAFAQRLAYGTVQQAKRLDHVIATLGKRPLAKLDPPVLHALRIGAYELLELGRQRDDADEIVAGGASAHAAVSQAVELVRGVVGERATAFTNAILRRAQVDGAAILERLDLEDSGDLAISLSMPEWLVSRVRAQHGADGIAALAAQSSARRGGAAFRINAAHPDAARAVELARELGAELEPAQLGDVELPGAVRLAGPTAAVTPLVESGLLVPQSLASQLVGACIAPPTGSSERLLDLCAAPGGKTTLLAAQLGAGGEVVAVELHEHRAESITRLAKRTCTDDRVRVVVADGTTLTLEELGGGGAPFDRVLVDAPCSGTGVLAARPDARWKRTEADVDGLVTLQRALLATAARLVRPGGIVVYSTCSILTEEDEAVVAHPPAGLEPDPLIDVPTGLVLAGSPHTMRTWPHLHDTEGFFVARFRRTQETAR